MASSFGWKAEICYERLPDPPVATVLERWVVGFSPRFYQVSFWSRSGTFGRQLGRGGGAPNKPPHLLPSSWDLISTYQAVA